MDTARVQHGDAATMANVCAVIAGTLSSPPDDATGPLIGRIASALGIVCDCDASAATLQRDYDDLFIVPNPRYVAPYESVYRERWEVPGALHTAPAGAARTGACKGLVMGESTLAVRRIQLEAGLQPERDLPDHVANELWLLAHLWKKEADAPPADRVEWARKRARFSNEHLMAWLGDLAAKVRENQRAAVYGAALEIAQVMAAVDDTGVPLSRREHGQAQRS